MDSNYDFNGLLNRYKPPNDVDKNDGGFVGLDYVVRIVPDLENESLMYECILCSIREGPLKMQQHLLSQKHRIAYLKRHFPTVLTEFHQYINNKKFDVLDCILDKLCEEIELYHGKGIIKEFPFKKFIGNKYLIYSGVIRQRHPSETNGPSFMDVVTTRDIDVFLKNQHLCKETVAKCERITFDSSFCLFNFPVSNSPKENNVNCGSEKNVARSQLSTSNTNRSAHKQNAIRSSSPEIIQIDENENDNDRRSDFTDRHSNFTDRNSNFTDRNSDFTDRHSDVTDRRSNFTDRNSGSNDRNSGFNDRNSGYTDRQTSRFNDQQFRPSIETVSSTKNFPVSQVPFFTPEVRNMDAICENNNYLLNKAIQSLDLAYKGYIRNIDSHPSYKSERLKFHQEKLIELEQLGIDVHTYDYHKEWIAFFTKRIHELYNASIRELHAKFNDNLILNTSSQYNQENRLNYFNNQISNMNSAQNMDPHGSRRGPCNERMSNTNLIERNDRGNMSDSVESIAILRVLAAFEDDLGRFGKSIVQLLTNCLRTEKIEKNSSLAMLLIPDHCMLLKSASLHLERKVIDFPRGPKVELFKKIIFDIQSFIKRAGRPSSSSASSHNIEQSNFHRSGNYGNSGLDNSNRNIIQPLMSLNCSSTGNFQTIGESQQNNIGNNSSWQHMQQNQHFSQLNLPSQQFLSPEMIQHHLNAHHFAQQHALANTYPQLLQQNNNAMQQYCMQPNSTLGQFMQSNSTQGQFLQSNSTQGQFMQSNSTQGQFLQSNSTQGQFLQSNSTQGQFMQSNSTQGHFMQSNSTQGQFMQQHSTQQPFMQLNNMQLQAMLQHQNQQRQTNRSTISENTENQNSGCFSPNRRNNKETKYLGNTGRVTKGANKYSHNRNSNMRSSDRDRRRQNNSLNSRFTRPGSRGRPSLTRTENQSKPKNRN